jgi:hypothetical protein
MSLKALANAVIERDRLAGQKRDTPSKSVPPRPSGLGQFVPPDSTASPEPSDASEAGAAAWRQGATPNSRQPLIPDAVRAIIEGLEGEARAMGWPAELLWNSEFWGSPRGLAAMLDVGDAIAEVTADYIAILKVERTILRFQRRVS